MIPYCVLIPLPSGIPQAYLLAKGPGVRAGLYPATAYAGIGLAPANLLRTVHYNCLFTAFAGMLLLSICLGWAILRSQIFSKAICLFISRAGPILGLLFHDLNLGIGFTTQIGLSGCSRPKIVIYLQMIVFIVQGLGTYLNVNS